MAPRVQPGRALNWAASQRQVGAVCAGSGWWFTAPWLARHARPDELSRLLAGRGWPARILLTATRPGYARLDHRAFGR